jgi:hypothetical protein
MSKFWLSTTVAAGAAFLLGCAGEQTPVQSLEQSKAAIRAAEEVGASKIPQASLHLQYAKEESQRAEDLIANGDKNRGASLLMRAEADANLAVAMSREAQERHEAQQAADRARDLQQHNPINP